MINMSSFDLMLPAHGLEGSNHVCANGSAPVKPERDEGDVAEGSPRLCSSLPPSKSMRPNGTHKLVQLFFFRFFFHVMNFSSEKEQPELQVTHHMPSVGRPRVRNDNRHACT